MVDKDRHEGKACVDSHSNSLTESDQEIHESVHPVNSSVSSNFMKVANIACAGNNTTTGKMSELSTMYFTSVGEQTNFSIS